MSIRVLVSGARGRMGQLSVQTITDHPDLELVGEVSERGTLQDHLVDLKPDVTLDVTSHTCVHDHTQMILASGSSPVIGTSGLSKQDVLSLQAQGCPQGGIIVPNFSIGMALLNECLKMIAPHMSDAAIIEGHHPAKKDAPSASARHSAKIIDDHRCMPSGVHESRELLSGALGASEHGTPIHSLRLPGILAEEEVLFSCGGERLKLSHQTHSYQAFAQGIVLSCLKVGSLTRLEYGLSHLLEL